MARLFSPHQAYRETALGSKVGRRADVLKAASAAYDGLGKPARSASKGIRSQPHERCVRIGRHFACGTAVTAGTPRSGSVPAAASALETCFAAWLRLCFLVRAQS